MRLTKAQKAALEPMDRTLGGRPIVTGRRPTMTVLRRLRLVEGTVSYGRYDATWESAYLSDYGLPVARGLYPDNELLPPPATPLPETDRSNEK